MHTLDDRKLNVKTAIKLGLWVMFDARAYPSLWCVVWHDSEKVVLTIKGHEPNGWNTVTCSPKTLMPSTKFVGYGKYRAWRKFIPFGKFLIKPYSKPRI